MVGDMVRELEARFPWLSSWLEDRLDTDVPAFLVSLTMHGLLLIALAFMGYRVHRDAQREFTSAVADNLALTYGHLRGEETAILAMGKLGGYEMTATSDLDLILVYDFDETQPESNGARPLHRAQYLARLTQRLINA